MPAQEAAPSLLAPSFKASMIRSTLSSDHCDGAGNRANPPDYFIFAWLSMRSPGPGCGKFPDGERHALDARPV